MPQHILLIFHLALQPLKNLLDLPNKKMPLHFQHEFLYDTQHLHEVCHTLTKEDRVLWHKLYYIHVHPLKWNSPLRHLPLRKSSFLNRTL